MYELEPFSLDKWRKQCCLAMLHQRRARFQVARLFDGISPLPVPSASERERCRAINNAFDEARLFFGKSELDIFRDIYYVESVTESHLSEFLRDVRSCPQEVIDYLEKINKKEKRARSQ